MGIASYDGDATFLGISPKWGFLIYRCDYRDDEAWKTFIDKWSNRVRSCLLDQYGDTSLVKTLEFTVKDNQSSLNNASVEQIHKIFTEWTRSEEAQAEQKDAVKTGHISIPRYMFCVHVDAPSLDGCLKYLSLPREEADKYLLNVRCQALGEAAYINIVRVEKVWYFPSVLTGDWGNPYENGQEEEEDDEEDKGVISVKMHLPYVLPATYAQMFDCDDLGRWDRGFARDRNGIYEL
jgi:hypothetical protein